MVNTPPVQDDNDVWIDSSETGMSTPQPAEPEIDCAATPPITIGQLRQRFERKRKQARGSADVWDYLIHEAREFSRGSEQDHLTTGAPWELTSITISGVRGITADGVDVEIPRGPGLTVIHGRNGSGKSSFTEGLDLALRGELARRSPQSRHLWQPVALAQGCDDAKASVTLVRPGEQLVLTTRVTQSEATHRAETTIDGVSLSSSLNENWEFVLKTRPPVLAYSDLEQRLQSASDLSGYLTDLFALGPECDRFVAHLDELKASSHAVVKRWKDLFATAKRRVDEVDAELAAAAGKQPQSLKEPKNFGDPDKWFDTTNADTGGDPIRSVSLQEVHEIQRLAQAYIDASTALANSGEDTAVAAALDALLQACRDSAEHSPQCPVCRNADADWLAKLAATCTELASAVKSVKALEHAERSLIAALQTDQNPQLWEPGDTNAGLPDVAKAVQLIVEDGDDLSWQERRNAVYRAATTLLSAEGESSMRTVVKRVAADAQWTRERGNAIREFMAFWQENKDALSKHDMCQKASKSFSSLRNELNDERKEGVHAAINGQVLALLKDSGIHIEDLKLRKQGTPLGLAGPSGALETGMLSAGQRNALLLAPVIASAQGGPFGFVVLDDPVHAFDDIRVDALARQLASLAKIKRVVVLTHDERLREQLVAQTETHLLTCDRGLDGEITIATNGPAWRELILDAAAIAGDKQRDADQKDFRLKPPLDRASREGVRAVRAILRQAVDAALRQHVLTQQHRDPLSWDVGELDKKKTTAERFEFVLTQHELPAERDNTSLSQVQRACSKNPNPPLPLLAAHVIWQHYRNSWNASSHPFAEHDETESVSLGREELQHCKRLCEHLTEEALS